MALNEIQSISKDARRFPGATTPTQPINTSGGPRAPSNTPLVSPDQLSHSPDLTQLNQALSNLYGTAQAVSANTNLEEGEDPSSTFCVTFEDFVSFANWASLT
ncbi:hypothetical protein N7539_007691 [Penicillium diatomitis]|uniref:Uncharacterized protein n=1 Tax=Penicillium diatomitis TaxID=2819901 RepID=A0A9W9WLN5_9EURO|nr:uncharacterized protein N7539_009356 [Penicillium diatomitis]XP_056787157.1 uncharacterized protein N7539_007691 [Penicillium diatomitis]KAJ5469738.1 hypothetical protein N7539_009356 [Penicillium diatomitis]KAJ5475404.1 hypothetical protein N7539_007691 [Penicillium diatomitis]